MSRLPPLLLLPLLAAMSATPVLGSTPAGTGSDVVRVGDVQLMSQRHWWWLMGGAAALRFDAVHVDHCDATARATRAVHVSRLPGVGSTHRPTASAPAAAPARNG